jgi:hypothetical protein
VGRFAEGERASDKSVGFAENRLDCERSLGRDGKLVCPLAILGRQGLQSVNSHVIAHCASKPVGSLMMSVIGVPPSANTI